MKILIVDDEACVRKIAAFALRRVGHFEVFEADGARAGIRLAEEVSPDVVLMDVMLGDMSGLEAVALLRRRPGMEEIPVLLFTASTDMVTPDVIDDLKVSGVVLKPFDPMTLGDTIRAKLRSRSTVDRFQVPAIENIKVSLTLT